MRRFILIILLVLTPALLVADYHTYKLQLEEAVAKKEQYIKDFEAAGILRLRAIMVAKCKDYYEISFQGNDRALLFTHDSVFSSPGNFSLLAKKIRTKRVTTKDGWEQEFDAFEELTEDQKKVTEAKISELEQLSAKIDELELLKLHSRFTRAEDGIITDLETSIQWVEGPDRSMSWNETKEWIKKMGGEWRMPRPEDMAFLIGNRGRFDFLSDIFVVVAKGRNSVYLDNKDGQPAARPFLRGINFLICPSDPNRGHSTSRALAVRKYTSAGKH